jgi:hypothetical protein
MIAAFLFRNVLSKWKRLISFVCISSPFCKEVSVIYNCYDAMNLLLLKEVAGVRPSFRQLWRSE